MYGITPVVTQINMDGTTTVWHGNSCRKVKTIGISTTRLAQIQELRRINRLPEKRKYEEKFGILDISNTMCMAITKRLGEY